MDSFYILTRYPDTLPGSFPDGLPDVNNANEVLKTAKEIYSRVKKSL